MTENLSDQKTEPGPTKFWKSGFKTGQNLATFWFTKNFPGEINNWKVIFDPLIFLSLLYFFYNSRGQFGSNFYMIQTNFWSIGVNGPKMVDSKMDQKFFNTFNKPLPQTLLDQKGTLLYMIYSISFDWIHSHLPSFHPIPGPYSTLTSFHPSGSRFHFRPFWIITIKLFKNSSLIFLFFKFFKIFRWFSMVFFL